jgi:single-stranded-DNA-specific exonuclease
MLMQAVGFGLGDLAERLPAGARIDVAFEPKINTWQGRKRPDMHVMDLRLA